MAQWDSRDMSDAESPKCQLKKSDYSTVRTKPPNIYIYIACHKIILCSANHRACHKITIANNLSIAIANNLYNSF